MKIFLDTANLQAIKEHAGIYSGITTNPAIMAKDGAEQKERLIEICKIVPDLPISGEVIYSLSTSQVIQDALTIAAIAPNIVVKIPGDAVGMGAISFLKKKGIKLNVTALMTGKQLIIAALLGADYVSQFYCRGKDAGLDSIREIAVARSFIEEQELDTQIIVGSLRSVDDVEQVLLSGAHIATITPELIKASFSHFKTDESILEFANK